MAYDFSSLKKELKDAEEWLGKEYLALHTGRATPAVLDKVQVESYGARQAIAHVASISVEDARSLLVAPWDKALVKEIERAVAAANLGLTTSVSDRGIRVLFPELTGDRRAALSKIVKERLEDARVTVRKEREKTWEDIQVKEKEGKLTEDEKFRYKDELQKLIDDTNKKLEGLAERKTKDITG